MKENNQAKNSASQERRAVENDQSRRNSGQSERTGDSGAKLRMACVIVLVTLAVYIPAMRAGYVWDDIHYVPDDPAGRWGQLIHPSDGLVRIWTAEGTSDYWPLTHTMFWVEWRLWGSNPAGYHVVNILLHALAAILVWQVLKRLGLPGAWLGGLIFAVHPVCVASVAWISERKNTLSMVFYLLTILTYLKYERSASQRCYIASVVLFILALLSKTSVVMLPVVLLGCTWWQRGRISWKQLRATLPFFAMAAAMALVTIQFQRRPADAQWITPAEGFLVNLAGSAWAVWFYLYKALLPVKLCMIYPKWSIDVGAIVSWLPMVGLIAVVCPLWWFRRTWGRPGLFAVGYFIVSCFPILGLFDMAFLEHSRVADHFQYIPILGVIALVAGVLGRACSVSSENARKVAQAVTVVLVAALSVLTWRQASIYEDAEMLWKDTLAKNPRAAAAHNNLAILLVAKGQLGEAIESYNKAIEANPRYATAYNNRALAYQKKGQYEEAIGDYDKAIELNPGIAAAYASRGILYAQKGDLDRAIRDYNTAIKVDPTYDLAYNNRGVAYGRKGDLDQAIRDYNKTIELNPTHPSAYTNRGIAYGQKSDWDRAIPDYNKAIELDPSHAMSYNSRGIAYENKGDLEQAFLDFNKAIELNPNLAIAYNSRGGQYSRKKDYDRAIRDFDRAIELNPNLAAAFNNRGMAHKSLGNWDAAIRDFQKAIELNPSLVSAYMNRGIAYAQKRNYDRAILDFSKVIELSPDEAPAYNNRGSAYHNKREHDRAIRDYDMAIRLDPTYTLAYNNRATANRDRGQLAQATSDYHRAIKLDPRYPPAYVGLAATMAQLGKPNEAIQHYRYALELESDSPEALWRLAWMLSAHADATIRDGEEAIRLAERACRLTSFSLAPALDALAAAYGETGQFEKAGRTAETAHQLALAAGNSELAEAIRSRLELYKAGRPYRDTAQVKDTGRQE